MKSIHLIIEFGSILLYTLGDVAPILLLIAFYQILVIKKQIPNLRKVLLGFVFVILGLAFFLMGLEKALFPIGKIMAFQLSSPEFVKPNLEGKIFWGSYYWIYIFSALVGFSTTLAEPALKAVAIKANAISGGSLNE